MEINLAELIAKALHQKTHDEDDIGPIEECDAKENPDGWVGDAYIHYIDAAETALNIQIIQACPDCEGTGDGMLLYGMPDACVHPNAPTIRFILTEWLKDHHVYNS